MPPPRRQPQRTTRRDRRLARLLRTCGVLAALLALTLAGLWVTRSAPTKRASTPPSTESRPAPNQEVIPSSFMVPPLSLIATLHGPTSCYASSTSATVTG